MFTLGSNNHIISRLKIIQVSNWIRSVFLILSSLIGVNAIAQICPSGVGQAFISTKTSSAIGSQLQALNYGSGATTFQPIGGEWPTGQYNAIAYNPADNKIYASSYQTSGTSGHLLQIEPSTGAVTDLGQITGMLNDGSGFAYEDGFNAGAFDSAGNYWVADGGDSAIYKVNLTTRVATKLALIGGGVDQPDFTFMGGYLWLAQSPTNILRIDTNTGNVNGFTLPFSLGSASVFGAAFTYPNQDIAIMGNQTGELNRIAISNPGSASPTFTLISKTNGPVNQSNDGTICYGSPIDLSISKIASAATVLPGAPVTWTLTVKNNDATKASSGFVIRDVFPGGLGNLSTSTPGCSFSGSILTCTTGNLAAGASYTVTVDSIAPSTAVTYTNTATVLGNDPDPIQANNSADYTITVQPIVTPQPDSGSGTVGTPITPIDVLSNDTTNGVTSTLTNSTITVVTPASNPGVVLDPAT
ncbi:DUF11 domain-containing protein, partial [Comamonas testosteroni]